MKRFLSLILALMLAMSLAACGDTSGNSKELSATAPIESSATQDEASEDDASAPDDAVPAEDESSENEGTSNEISVAEQVLYDSDGIKITATGLNQDGFTGPELSLLIENNSDSNIGIGSDYTCVNGYMVSNLFSAEVAAGKKSNETYTLSSSELEMAGITDLATISFELHFYDPDTFMTTTEVGLVTATTSISDTYVQEYDATGDVLMDDYNVKVVAKELDPDYLFGASVYLYYENNTDSTIVVQSDNVSVNGFMVSAFSSVTLLPSSHAVSGITLLQSSLDDNGIEDINDVEFTLSVLDYDTFGTLYTSEPLTVYPAN